MRTMAAAIFCLTGLLSAGAWAAERSVVLHVDNMTCSSCPVIVKRAIAAVPGVAGVAVSYADKTAVVAFDDAKADATAIADAATKAGFPARPAR